MRSPRDASSVSRSVVEDEVVGVASSAPSRSVGGGLAHRDGATNATPSFSSASVAGSPRICGMSAGLATTVAESNDWTVTVSSSLSKPFRLSSQSPESRCFPSLVGPHEAGERSVLLLLLLLLLWRESRTGYRSCGSMSLCGRGESGSKEECG